MNDRGARVEKSEADGSGDVPPASCRSNDFRNDGAIIIRSGIEGALPSVAINIDHMNVITPARDEAGENTVTITTTLDDGSSFSTATTTKKPDTVKDFGGSSVLQFDDHHTFKTTFKDDTEETEAIDLDASSHAASTAAAAVPTVLRPNRRISLPGAFRMSRAGMTPANEDVLIDNETNESGSSIGFRTDNANEVLIEATLVCDRSQSTADVDWRRYARTRPIGQTAVTLVEAKRLRCLCCERWKSLCFIVLVIVAIAGVAIVVERYRQAPEVQSNQDSSDRIDGAASLAPTLPSLETENPNTLAPTNLFGDTVVLAIEDPWILTQAPFSEAPSFNPTESITSSLSESPNPGTAAPIEPQLHLPTYTLDAIHTDPSSAQAMAWQWLNDDSNRNVLLASKLAQRFALAVFYIALKGAEWWKGNEMLFYQLDECDWAMEHVCSEDGQIRQLSVSSTGRPVSGTLPAETWMLTSLTSLLLISQDIAGELTEDIAAMSNLKHMTLVDLSLAGTLPTQLGQLQEMTSLELQQNNIYGTVPTEIGQMKELRNIYIHSNSLSGVLPKLGNLSRLERIYLSKNNLTGSLPIVEIAAGSASSLRLVELGSNQLSGTLPTDLGLLTNLESLDLYDNNFTGPLPSTLENLSNLTMLLLDSNSLTGRIPSSFGRLAVSELWLENNNLSGLVPEELCLLKEENGLFISIDCDKVACSCGCICGDDSSYSSVSSISPSATNFTT